MADVTRELQARPGRILMTREEQETFTLKDMLRRFFDQVETQGDLSHLRDFLTPECRLTHPLLAEPGIGMAGITELVRLYHRAFPDIRFQMTDIVLEDGHKVAIRAVVTGTQTGSWQGKPATKRQASWATAAFVVLHHGKIHRIDVIEDLAGLQRQLGLDAGA